jgi:hypothetical protein
MGLPHDIRKPHSASAVTFQAMMSMTAGADFPTSLSKKPHFNPMGSQAVCTVRYSAAGHLQNQDKAEERPFESRLTVREPPAVLAPDMPCCCPVFALTLC